MSDPDQKDLNMKIIHRKRSCRQGSILVLSCIMLIVAFILVAFVLNLGYILLVKEELQKAADSAALAGASQILVAQSASSPLIDSRASSDINLAISEAKKFCLKNSARVANLKLLDSDIVVGYSNNPANPQSELTHWSSGQPYPNAVKVIVRRDSTANAPLPLFLSSFLGMSTWNGQSTATACASRRFNVTGFNTSTINAPLLPVTISVADWNAFVSTGKSPDGKIYDDFSADNPLSSKNVPPSNVSSKSDRIPEFELIGPDWICIGPDASDTNTLRNWIDNGASPADLASFGAQGMQEATSSPKVPGVKSTVTKNLQAAIGQSRVIPIHSSCDGKNYQLAGFAGVVIVDASGNGSHLRIRFQPATVRTPTATISGESWNGTNSFIYTTSPLALVQ